MIVTTVSTKVELEQIYTLNQQNLKQNLTLEQQEQEGFVSWLYSPALLEQMHNLAPSIIAKQEDQVVGYALTTLREASAFHQDLKEMFQNLEAVTYKDKPLFEYSFYCMGQICVAKEFRGQGLVTQMYQKHKEVYSAKFDFILTEISTRNIRSQKAHEKIGFRTIHTHRDSMDDWNVVIWEW